ncbi:MAG TPA: ABA4-like family protein [Pseudomonadales bacterium]|nr:ABA4-like family protein [Pseudomonadales bacterium]
MNAMNDTIFSLAGALAMIGWLGLVFLPRVDLVVKVIARLVIPALIAIVYAGLMLANLDAAPEAGGFGSLAGVKALFGVDGLLLAGWIHYLAFDLFVGSWEVEDARARGVPHLLVLPCLFATFMAGPAGLGLYLLLRGGTALARRGDGAASGGAAA